MSSPELSAAPVLVIGAGIMGAGIAQVAAQSGHRVFLFDVREGAASQARAKLDQTLQGLQGKGKITAQAAAQTLSRIAVVDQLAQANDVGLVIEAIVENLDAKRALFQQLETVVGPECVLATNTSSISVTAIANGLQHPGRLVGMHFFNPVPLMKLVEVVSGLQTDSAVAQAIFELSETWGKVPVHARSTPGFIVNRIARPFYAETLALLHERAAQPAELDACLRAVGFRMGPCELMDLIGHDTNFAVTQSVFEANFYDKRYVPSLVQRELVDAGLLGRKSGRGFFDYRAAHENPSKPSPEIGADPKLPPPEHRSLTVMGRGPWAEHWAQALDQAGLSVAREPKSDWLGLDVDGAQLRMSDGRTASMLGRDVAVFDRPTSQTVGAALAWAASGQASGDWVREAPNWLRMLGVAPIRVQDTPALVVTRTLAMLINEAADAVQQGVCSIDGANAAMRLGVNYPAGPFDWLGGWSAAGVISVLEALDAHYRGERYRVSPWLRQHAAAH